MKCLRVFLTGLAVTLPIPALAQNAVCTAADFAAAVDRSGAQLRNASREAQPKLQERMARYKEAKGLSDSDYETAALEAIQDKTLEDLDAKSSELLLKIDGLGRIPDGREPNCAELGDIEVLSKELLATVRAKSEHMLANLDAKIAEAGGGKAADKAEHGKEKVAAKEKEPAKDKEPVRQKEPAKEKDAAATPPKQVDTRKPESWSATTKPTNAYAPGVPPRVDAVPGAPDAMAGASSPDGFSIEEIQEATRGFFGTISTSLASVLEHAFKTAGRPTAYVLGSEGGGAFLAGLRFGEGTLYMRHKPETRKVWWHGPSIGGDLGAAGGRTMFLIYKLEDQDALYRNFTGVDGSAFFVGGVGMTVLKGGDVIMAPIRTGIGFRVGANIGYVRFTRSPTWNPF